MTKRIIFIIFIILFIALLSAIFVFINLNKNDMEQKSKINLTSIVFKK